MIELKNVSFSFEDGVLFQDVSFRVEDGQFVGVIGANGAGKTTLIRLILGLIKPSKGEVINTEKKIAYVSQTTSLNDSSFPATVEEIVSLGLVGAKPSLFHWKEEKERVKVALEKMDILPLRKKVVSELSGGQLQRVKIAKALVGDPSLIVLDEPDAGMDHDSHEKLVEGLLSLHTDHGIAVLFISHHLHDLESADQILLVKDGSVTRYQGGDHHVEL